MKTCHIEAKFSLGQRKLKRYSIIQSSYSIAIVFNDLTKKLSHFSNEYHTISYQNNHAKVKCAAINNECNVNNKKTLSYDIKNRNDTL